MKKIDQARETMIKLAAEKGLAHPDTIRASKDLDELLNLFAERKEI